MLIQVDIPKKEYEILKKRAKEDMRSLRNYITIYLTKLANDAPMSLSPSSASASASASVSTQPAQPAPVEDPFFSTPKRKSLKTVVDFPESKSESEISVSPSLKKRIDFYINESMRILHISDPNYPYNPHPEELAMDYGGLDNFVAHILETEGLYTKADITNYLEKVKEREDNFFKEQEEEERAHEEYLSRPEPNNEYYKKIKKYYTEFYGEDSGEWEFITDCAEYNNYERFMSDDDILSGIRNALDIPYSHELSTSEWHEILDYCKK